MALDFSLAPAQILVDQINDDNSSSFTTALFNFGVPAADGGAKNTKIVLTAAGGSGYSGTRDIYYNRVDLATVPGNRGTTFQVGDAETLAELIPEINTLYGINLTAADYNDVAIPAFPGEAPHETQTINLVAKSGSIVWRGTLVLTLNANDIDLVEAIENNSLNGLTYTPPA